LYQKIAILPRTFFDVRDASVQEQNMGPARDNSSFFSQFRDKLQNSANFYKKSKKSAMLLLTFFVWVSDIQ